MKYYLLTLGCQMNKSDSERVSTLLNGIGFVPSENEEEANLLGILACSVRQKSIDKVYSRITKWNKWKNSKTLITFVTGCVLPDNREKFLKLFDFVFPMTDLLDFPDMLKQYGVVTPISLQLDTEKNSLPKVPQSSIELDRLIAHSKSYNLLLQKEQKTPKYLEEQKINYVWKLNPSYTSSFEAFIPIQNGCDKFCTFCAVPYTRGREISRPSEDILQEVEVVLNQGFRAITLLGQNVNSYGKDTKGTEISFPQLLEKIGEFGNKSGKKFWVYFTSPHPGGMTDEVLKVIARYDCLAKQIHLPLQSGDDKVLIRMNRKHSLEEYRQIIKGIQKYIPEATLFTDIIVGFTGETDEQFENSRKAMKEFRFNMAYIAIYSPRPGAKSSRWKDDIPHAVKKERLHILSRELTRHTLIYNQNLVGTELSILVTGPDRKEGHLAGMTEGRIVCRFASTDKNLIGQFIRLNVTAATEFSIEGELVKSEVEAEA